MIYMNNDKRCRWWFISYNDKRCRWCLIGTKSGKIIVNQVLGFWHFSRNLLGFQYLSFPPFHRRYYERNTNTWRMLSSIIPTIGTFCLRWRCNKVKRQSKDAVNLSYRIKSTNQNTGIVIDTFPFYCRKDWVFPGCNSDLVGMCYDGAGLYNLLSPIIWHVRLN